MSADKPSDLPARTASALVMVAGTGAALWAGGWWWNALVAMVSGGVLWEWARLSLTIARSGWARGLWLIAGVVYIGVGALVLARLREVSATSVLVPLMAVIATDIGAFFAGRAIGGPKIAPSISPSKTWAGLAGAMLAAGLLYAAHEALGWSPTAATTDGGAARSAVALRGLIVGAGIAILAQMGDFFESWMKRRAGVKDSGNLIPGHGGLFDRVDGLLPICFVLWLLSLGMR